jgi:hypothetical protein
MTDYSPAFNGAIGEAARRLGLSSLDEQGVTKEGLHVAGAHGKQRASAELGRCGSFHRPTDRRFISSCVIKRCSVFSADPGKLMNLKPSV